MFCFSNSLKSSNKPRKARSEINENNGKINSDSQSNGENHPHLTDLIDIRYVTSNFIPVAEDELSVSPGDFVVYEFSVSDSNGKNWAHVKCLSTKKAGFVPNEILSTTKPNPQFKKKMPRIQHRTHHISDQPSSNGDDVRLHHHHARHHQPRFDPPHSLQGSSGKLSFLKNPYLGHFNAPAYYNVSASDPHFDEASFPRPFRLQNLGYYTVLHNFVAREENDLNVRPGDCVTVLNKDDDNWYWVQRQDDRFEGFVPSGFLCSFDQVQNILNKGNSTVTMKSSNHDFHTYINHRPERGSLTTDQQSFVCQNP